MNRTSKKLCILLALNLSTSLTFCQVLEIDLNTVQSSYKFQKKADTSQHIQVLNANGFVLHRNSGSGPKTLKVINNVYTIPPQTAIGKKKYVLNKTGATDMIFEVDFLEPEKSSVDSSKTSRIRGITQLPFPIFTESVEAGGKDESLMGNKNRYLIIDASANPEIKQNNLLLKYDESGAQKNATEISWKSSLSVLIKNYNFQKVETATVSVNGTNYTYEKGFSDLYDEIKGSDQEDTSTKATSKVLDTLSPDSITLYLETVYKTLENTKKLNVEDVYLVENYKQKLRETIDSSGIQLTLDQITLLSQIFSWKPDYVSLTPISIPGQDADEITVELSLKSKGESSATKFDLGSYHVSGGVDFDINSTLFVTNLVNSDVYTDSITVNDTTKQLRAHIDGQKQITLGMGVNGEVSFRTGTIVRPSVSMGFFVPFDEEVSPNVAMGLGISLNTQKVKFAISGGPAFASINRIQERYRGKDLSQFSDLTNESLTAKEWKVGWQIGFGLSYSIK